MTEILILVLFKYACMLLAFVLMVILLKGSVIKKLAAAFAIAAGIYLLFDLVLFRVIWTHWMESQPPSIRLSFEIQGFSQQQY